MNFFEVLYAKKNGAALPANFFDLLFAKSFTPAAEWCEYDGTPPATYSANGSMLADYRIYGAAGGVGDDSGTAYGYEVDMCVRSENLFDYSDLETGSISISDGTNVNNAAQKRTQHYINVSPSLQYTFHNANGSIRVHEYTLSNAWIRSVLISTDVPYVASSNTAKIRLAAMSESFDVQMLLCQFFTTTPIYIGSDPLGEDEYVSFKEQKVYRRTENYFNGYFEQGTTGGGIPQAADNRVRSNIIAAVAGAFCVDFKSKENFDVAFDFWNGKVLVEATAWLNVKNYITPNNATNVRIKIRKSNDAPVTPAEIIDFGMYSGSTAPEQYIPYLQPQDPPVPLPAMPTVDGINVVDYAGQSAAVPSRFVAKYQRK